MVFNWKREPNPLIAKDEEVEVEADELPEAEALPFEISDAKGAARRDEVMNAVAKAAPDLLPPPEKPRRAKEAAKDPAPKREAPALAPPASATPPAPAPAPKAPRAPVAPATPYAAGTGYPTEAVAALRESFAASQRAFAEHMEQEIAQLSATFESSLATMSERVNSLTEEVAARDRRLAEKDAELQRLRGALKKVIDEAFDGNSP